MQFFELFNKLIDMKARINFLSGDLAYDMTAIYDPKDLLNQIIDNIKQQQINWANVLLHNLFWLGFFSLP